MGGFSMDYSALGPNAFPGHLTRLTLTSAAILKLAENEPVIIPDIDADHILDKSKANIFAKIIVCVQASWFIVQIIGRLSTGYALSLLEITTFAHALCCLVVYCCWWSKPMAIDTPTLIPISGSRAQKICAWLLMASWSGASRQICYEEQEKLIPTSWFGHLIHNPSDNFELVRRDRELRYQNSETPDEATTTLMRLKPREGIHEFYFVTATGAPIDFPPFKSSWVIPLSAADISCLAQAQALIEEDPIWSISYDKNIPNAALGEAKRRHLKSLFGGSSEQQLYPTTEYVTSHAYNFSRAGKPYKSSHGAQLGVTGPNVLKDFRERRSDKSIYSAGLMSRVMFMWTKRGNPVTGLPIWMSMFLALSSSTLGIAYGALHLLAWHAPFSSELEQTLWRVSAVLVTSTVPSVASVWWLLFMVAACLSRKFQRPIFHYRAWNSSIVSAVIWSIFFIASWALIISYTLARLYLVLECFISLPHVPAAVYEQPQWGRYIPHFGAG
jgi:hypothetical protein